MRAAAALALLLAAGSAHAWEVAGRQGLVLQVVLPEAEAKDRAAYDRELERLCGEQPTCFVNFYTNRDGAPLTLPLAESIAHQATATYRRSGKRGVGVFSWSCRLQLPGEPCF